MVGGINIPHCCIMILEQLLTMTINPRSWNRIYQVVPEEMEAPLLLLLVVKELPLLLLVGQELPLLLLVSVAQVVV